MFSKILVANRGEIACRVMRTARQMGIDTVAVYSDADRHALHVRSADESVNIGPAPAAQSYLMADAIISACQTTGAEAVHPGYGFLSEDMSFGSSLIQAGVTFIGPGADAIQSMGDKIASKVIARDAGVNVIPGIDDIIESPDHAVRLARQIGYPVMLKPTSAGGGKGMRLAYNDEECRSGFLRSTSEAKAHFGDDRVFLEKYIENPRHIEVQVLADKHGNVIHLGERECSLQRRHQKVIEEAPSPFLNEKTRTDITEQAVALARAVDYVSAGTVEFVVDANQNFYFLEMNTRLQVEHPVTEFVTGVDLVECMIRVAAGQKLELAQSDVATSGWAVESRIYAEDPARNFLPSTGRLIRCRLPAQSDSVRVDTGVEEGGDVSMHYDPMIAKLIVHENSRDKALSLMERSLDECHISGVTTNVPFLQALVRDPVVFAGDMHTRYIESKYPDGYDCETESHDQVTTGAMIAAIANYMNQQQSQNLGSGQQVREWTAPRDWVVLTGTESYEFSIQETSSGHRVRTCDGESVTFDHQWRPGQTKFYFTCERGDRRCAQIKRINTDFQVEFFGLRRRFRVVTPAFARCNQYMLEKKSAGRSPFLKSPMPGKLQDLFVEKGQTVKEGETIAVVEAMKMENSLRAERDGVVADVLARVGDSLAADQPILEYAEDAQ